MALKNYGVLKGRPIDVQPGTGSSPHYQVLISDDTSLFRIAVNQTARAANGLPARHRERSAALAGW